MEKQDNERKTSGIQRLRTEVRRMRLEGFVIPPKHHIGIPVTDDMPRSEIRRLLAVGTLFYTEDGYEVPGEVALSIMDSTYGKVCRKNKEAKCKAE